MIEHLATAFGLSAAIKSGRVATAGLDVFEDEPKLHPEYISLKNTFLLPHYRQCRG